MCIRDRRRRIAPLFRRRGRCDRPSCHAPACAHGNGIMCSHRMLLCQYGGRYLPDRCNVLLVFIATSLQRAERWRWRLVFHRSTYSGLCARQTMRREARHGRHGYRREETKFSTQGYLATRLRTIPCRSVENMHIPRHGQARYHVTMRHPCAPRTLRHYVYPPR